MKIIEQSHEILQIDKNAIQSMEKAARTCYKSEDKITEGSAKKLIKTLYKSGHHAMLEFGDMTVKFITDRGVTHELVRHRLCSFAQESTRYVNYKTGVEFIRPVWCNEKLIGLSWKKLNNKDIGGVLNDAEYIWLDSCYNDELIYKSLIEGGWRPEQARSILPNSLKTEIVVKANLREWMHLLNLRCSKKAHPQIRELMLPLLKEVQSIIPILFDDKIKK